jgi:mRNA-degrading endonuclease toxin of MazEF toxin-antitoxin module
VVVLLTTSLKKRGTPTHVLVLASKTGLVRDSVVLCENPVCVSKDSLGRYLTHLPDEYMGQIARAHLLTTSAISFLDLESIAKIWRQARRLNVAP